MTNMLPPAPAPPPPPIRSRPRPDGILIGEDRGGEEYIIPYDELAKTHVQVIGTSGWGKSYTLLNMISQMVLSGYGLCLIDPDSSLYHMVLNFLIQRKIDPDRVVIINPLLEDWTLKASPLQSWDDVMGMGTDAATGAMLRVAGEDDFEGMPRLRRYLKSSCLALEGSGLPLAMLPWFCAMARDAIRFRRQVIHQVEDEIQHLQWDEFLQRSKKTQEEHIDSTVNRVMAFADDPRVRRMMAYSDGNLDWKQVMDEGKIVLCNLGQQGGLPLAREGRRLIGSSIIHGLSTAAHRRSVKNPRRCFVFCDEFAEYMSNDVADALDRCRKFGVHFVLAHQRLGQIGYENPNMLEALLDEAKIKIVFGGLGRDNAEKMAKELFTGQVDGDRVKRAVANTAFRPAIQWMEVLTESEGGANSTSSTVTEGTSVSEGGGHTENTGSSEGVSVLYTADSGMLFPTATGHTSTNSYQHAVSNTESWSQTDTFSTSISETETRTWAVARSRVPVTVHEEFQQPEQIERYSLEEVWEEYISLLVTLPRQMAVVKFTGRPATVIRTVDIIDRAAPMNVIAQFEQRTFQGKSHVVRREEADRHLEQLLRAYRLLPPRRTEFAAEDIVDVAIPGGAEPVLPEAPPGEPVPEPSSFALPERDDADLPRRPAHE